MRHFEELFKLMNALVDREMELHFGVEFKEITEDEFFRDFFNTFKKTVELCHRMECCQVPEEIHLSLVQAIEQITPKKRPRPSKKRKTKAKSLKK